MIINQILGFIFDWANLKSTGVAWPITLPNRPSPSRPISLPSPLSSHSFLSFSSPTFSLLSLFLRILYNFLQIVFHNSRTIESQRSVNLSFFEGSHDINSEMFCFLHLYVFQVDWGFVA
ncbi:hypothetical protein L6164_000824 [Bauhinia variegata]|uniref:Uncharacterized protein n=1 Tax=Bauhinia variegata TaxID=167791 RepID=A0ACB9Q9W7_BAUVA|nr:hypothetical protein L6164_000824 [Bauhinia variegata]